MSKHLTKNDIVSYIHVPGQYIHIVSAMESFGSRLGYNAGVYGWNWSAFAVNGVAMIHGYRNFPSCDIPVSDELFAKYDSLIAEAWDRKEWGHYARREFLNELVDAIREQQ